MARQRLLFKVTQLALVLLLWLPGLSLAGEPKPAEVKALVQKAVRHAQEHGLETLIRAVNDPSGPLSQGILRVFVLDTAQGILLADPLRPELTGRRVWDRIDLKGRKYYQAMAKAAEKGGTGWSDHFIIPPGGKYADIEAVHSELLPGSKILIGSGLFDMDAPTAAAQANQ